jgi:hypothetical protein
MQGTICVLRRLTTTQPSCRSCCVFVSFPLPLPLLPTKTNKTNSVALSPQANYTDWANATRATYHGEISFITTVIYPLRLIDRVPAVNGRAQWVTLPAIRGQKSAKGDEHCHVKCSSWFANSTITLSSTFNEEILHLSLRFAHKIVLVHAWALFQPVSDVTR